MRQEMRQEMQQALHQDLWPEAAEVHPHKDMLHEVRVLMFFRLATQYSTSDFILLLTAIFPQADTSVLHRVDFGLPGKCVCRSSDKLSNLVL